MGGPEGAVVEATRPRETEPVRRTAASLLAAAGAPRSRDRAAYFNPGRTTPLSPETESGLQKVTSGAIIEQAADAGFLSLGARITPHDPEAVAAHHTEWQQWVRDYVALKIEDSAHHPEGVDALRGLGLLPPQGEPVLTDRSLAFFHRTYFQNKSDIGQFILDIATKLDGAPGETVGGDELLKRLTAVSYLFHSFGHVNEIPSLVGALGESFARLLDTDRQSLIDAIKGQLPEPVDEGKEYLKLLAEKWESTVPAKEGQPGFTIRAGEKTKVGGTIGPDGVLTPKKVNEDQVWFHAGRKVGIICDGIGGSAGGAEASRIVMNSMKLSFAEPPEHATVEAARDWLIEQTHIANKAVKEAKERRELPDGAGTTLNIVYVWQDKLITLNIGDSRSAWEIDGKMEALTIDQSPFRLHVQRKPNGEIDYVFNRETKRMEALFGEPRKPEDWEKMQRLFGVINDPNNSVEISRHIANIFPEIKDIIGFVEEVQALWDRRNITLGDINGSDDLSIEEPQIRDIPPGKRVRIFGFSDGTTDVLSQDAFEHALSSADDPQLAMNNLITAAEQGDHGERSKKGRYNADTWRADDKACGELEITPEALQSA